MKKSQYYLDPFFIKPVTSGYAPNFGLPKMSGLPEISTNTRDFGFPPFSKNLIGLRNEKIVSSH